MCPKFFCNFSFLPPTPQDIFISVKDTLTRILGSGKGNGNPLQYSCLGNPMDRGSWQATVYGVAKSWTRLRMHTHPEAHMYMKFKEICI